MKKAALVLFLQACCLLQFVAQATPDRPLRDEVCLNGVWNLEIEGVEKPAQVRVPGSFAGQDELWGKEHWDVWDYPKDWRTKPAIYVRSIEISENLGNRRVLIHIGGVRHVVKVSVNGKEVGNWWDSYVPFEFDITEAVKPGYNELRIHVSDAKTCGLFEDYNSSRRGVYRDVFLKFVLEVRVTPDLFVKTSVQRGEIACDVPVRNDTPNPLPDYLVGTNIGGAKTAVALPLMGFFGDSFTPVCQDWKCASVTATSEPDGLVVTVKGQYTEAEGTFRYRFSNGKLHIDYDFTMLEDINPRQIGLVFTLPATHELLAWDRIGKWDFYPEDHIARLKGSVKASEGFEATSVGPRTEPQHPWRLDNLPAGNNDFCSTKHSVRQASLSDGNGSIFSIEGEGKTHIRCWKSASGIHLLAANFSHGGSERFLKSFTKRAERPLKKGQAVTGSVKING